ncbi:hypothetical protein LCGC14_1919330, partial [marine sediment metagenome]
DEAVPVDSGWQSKAIPLGATEQNVMPELWEEDDPVPDVPWRGSSITADFAIGTGKDLLGGLDVAKVIASAGAGEVVGGTVAAFGMAVFNQSPDDATETVEAWSDLITLDPWSDRGKEMLEKVAAPLIRLEQKVDDVSWDLSGGNPFAAALIKGTLLGTPEIFLPTKGVWKAGRANRLIEKRIKEFQNKASDLGIRVEMDNLAADVVDATRSLTPEYKAQNAPLLEKAMREAEVIAKNKKNAAYEAAKQTDAWVETRSVRQLGESLEARLLEEGYDLTSKTMKPVRDALDDFRSAGLGFEEGGSLSARLNQFDLLYKRVGKKYGREPQVNKALTKIKKGMNDFLDNEFIAVTQESRGALSGDLSAIQAWKDARAANTTWKKNFHEDKFIAKMIAKEMTSEEIAFALMGGTAMGARREMASTVARLKEVLGKDHPAIQGIKNDFLYEVASPLLGEKPNFTLFVRQYDKMIRNNPSLVKELGLKESSLTPIYEFSKLQTRLPAKHRLETGDMTRGLSQFLVGHQIARAALRVNISRNIANYVLKTDRVGAKQMLADMAGLKYGEVLIPKYSPIAAEFIAGAALTGIPDTQEL